MCIRDRVYGYQAYKHYHDGASLFIHPPKAEYSTAENILHILRPDSQFTPLEAKLLDTALILHMEHGGGNNSTFTTHLVSSSGTDVYKRQVHGSDAFKWEIVVHHREHTFLHLSTVPCIDDNLLF